MLSHANTFPVALLPDSASSHYYLCIQINNLKDLTPYKLQSIGAKIGNHVSKTSVKNLTFVWPNVNHTPELSTTSCGQIFKGLLLSDYVFDACITKNRNKKRAPFRIHHKTSTPDALKHEFSHISAVVDGEHLCKDLMHEPPNRLTPSEFSARIQELSSLGLTIDILDEKRLNEEIHF